MICTALLNRTVIIFRDQIFTETQHIEFTRRFGDLQPAAVSGFEKNAVYPKSIFWNMTTATHPTLRGTSGTRTSWVGETIHERAYMLEIFHRKRRHYMG